MKRPLILTNTDLNDESFVSWLRADELWYARSSRLYLLSLRALRITPIVLAFCVALVSAYQGKNVLGIDKNMVVIFLTGVSTLCITLITQLGLDNLARTREEGRIVCAHMVSEALLMFSTHGSREMHTQKEEFVQALFNLEKNQANSFFSAFLRTDRTQAEPGQPRDNRL